MTCISVTQYVAAMGMKPDKTPTLIGLGVLVVLLASETTWISYMNTSRPNKPVCALDSVEVDLMEKEGQINGLVRFRVSYFGSLKSKIRVVALPLTRAERELDHVVHVFFDVRYPCLGLGLREWIGLKDHLPIELQKVDFTAKIVDADDLPKAMMKQRSIVIIPSGIMPDTVYSAEGGLVSAWLAQGGTLIWIGQALGANIGHRDGTTEELGSLGQTKLLGYELGIQKLSYWDSIASDWTDFAHALGLSYLHAWTGPALNVLEEKGGLALGGIHRAASGREYSSVSLLPTAHGTGKVIIFGGGVGYAGAALGEDLVARDIAKILWSGLLRTSITGLRSRSGQFLPYVSYGSYEMDPGTSQTHTIAIRNLDVKTNNGQEYHQIAIMAFSMSPDTEFYVNSNLPISNPVTKQRALVTSSFRRQQSS